MPTLNWIGKEAVVKHHKEVPFRLLEPVPELSCGDADSGNLIVQGDNLHALKALLPRYAGQVKCIYIDPPYNTGVDDRDESGKVVSRFLPDLQRDLGLVYQPENWDEVRLATWLCRNLPEPSLTHASKQAFVAKWLTELLRRDGLTLSRANLQKFLIRNLLEARIRELRRQAVRKAFQQTLFGDDAASRVAVTDQYAFEFHAQAYAPSRDYDGRFGHFDFRKHFYGRIGDFDSKEEFECACWLDIQAQRGRIQFWVRNLVRREGSSFFLQKADGRFYPDFLCQLTGKGGEPGPILAVEYKGADRWAAVEEDRLIGGLWANLSEGRCRFVMVKDKRWESIEEHLK